MASSPNSHPLAEPEYVFENEEAVMPEEEEEAFHGEEDLHVSYIDEVEYVEEEEEEDGDESGLIAQIRTEDDDDDDEEEEEEVEEEEEEGEIDFGEEEEEEDLMFETELLAEMRRTFGEPGKVEREEEEETEPDASGPPSCPICFRPWTSCGPHRVCCLPCGHVHGRSCLEKWLQQCGETRGKCPQCNRNFRRTDIINLYAPVDVVPNDGLNKEMHSLHENNEILEQTSGNISGQNDLDMGASSDRPDLSSHSDAMRMTVAAMRRIAALEVRMAAVEAQMPRLANLESQVTQLVNLQHEMAELRNEMAVLRNKVDGLETEMVELRNSVAEVRRMRADTSGMEAQMQVPKRRRF